MGKKHSKKNILSLKQFEPLDSKNKILSLVEYLNSSEVVFTSQKDILICGAIRNDNLRFYYETIRPRIQLFNTPSRRKKARHGVVSSPYISKGGLDNSDPIKKFALQIKEIRENLLGTTWIE